VGRTDEAQYITEEFLAELEAEMLEAAKALEFERAAVLRDRIERMRDSLGEPVASVRESSGQKSGRRGRGRGRVPRPKRNA
jgi:excinuclease ABC subunit B